MVSIVTKNIKGNKYLYLVKSQRDGSRVVQETLKYIGKKRPIPKEEFKCMEYSANEEDWILDYNDELSYQEHEALKQASKSQFDYLKLLDKATKENQKEKFLSEFISNSNAIEGSTLSAKETYDYLFNDIVPSHHTKKEFHMAANLLNAWNYLELNFERLPTKEDLCQLHQQVNYNIETNETLGKYKVVQNYIGDLLTTSYLFTDEKMTRLLDWIKKAFSRINNFEVAFQSHAQFEVIHPFVDGNGRVGRLLMNWILHYKKINPVAVNVKQRNNYISALNNFRKGKKEAICKFLSKQYLRQYEFE